MHTIKLNAVIDSNRQMHLQLPPDTPAGSAEVVVTITTTDANAAPMTSLREFFAELDSTPLKNPRSLEEIEAQIAAERASWN